MLDTPPLSGALSNRRDGVSASHRTHSWVHSEELRRAAGCIKHPVHGHPEELLLTAQELLDQIRHKLDGDSAGIRDHLAELPAPEIADLINQLTLAEAASLIALLPAARAIEVCDQPTLRRRSAILEQIDPPLAATILDGLSADQRATAFRQMGQHECHRLLPTLRPESRAEVEHLLHYPAHTAGGIMTTEFVRLDPTMSVAEALKQIRSVARDRESNLCLLRAGTRHRQIARSGLAP